ncbi:MAG: hypothetical protein SOH81_07770 [Acetobacter sp.]|jgi:predicted KAP-like P-loop ATPase
MKPIAWVALGRLPGNGRRKTTAVLSERKTSSEPTALYSAQQMAQKDAEIQKLNEELSMYRDGMDELIAKEVALLVKDKGCE